MRTPRVYESIPQRLPKTAIDPAPNKKDLRALAQKLNDALTNSDIDSVATLAEQFRSQFKGQVEDLYAANGFFADIESADPCLAPKIRKGYLRAQNVLRLLANIREAALFSLEKVRELIPMFLFLFRRYEIDIQRVIHEFYYMDGEGGGAAAG